MDETPKKLVSSDVTSCFLCSKSVNTKERIRIFGRSKDIENTISATIDIDLAVYDNSDLFICLKCYKQVTKVKKIETNLLELKKELKSVYCNQDHRVKRLRRSPELHDRDQRQSTSTTTTKKRLSAKSLNFSDQIAAEKPSTCTSSSDFTALPCVLPRLDNLEFSPIPGPSRVHTIFPSFPSVSTPKQRPTETKVKLVVEYPSKTFNKSLDPDLEALGKALAHGPPSRIAKAAIKCRSIQKQLIEQVLRIVSGEVNSLCSRKNPSLLRKSGKEDLQNYDMEKLCDEWKDRAPVFYSFLLTSCTSKSSKHVKWFPSVALAGSILLKQRNNHMSATASVMGILAKTRSIEVIILTFLLFLHAHLIPT